MRNIIIIMTICSLIACRKGDKCDSGQYFFGNSCYDQENYTIYKAVVGQFCSPDSVMIALDYDAQTVKWKNYNNFVSGNWTVTNRGGVNGVPFTVNYDHGYDIDCPDDIPANSTFYVDDIYDCTRETTELDVLFLYHPDGLNYLNPRESATDSVRLKFYKTN